MSERKWPTSIITISTLINATIVLGYMVLTKPETRCFERKWGGSDIPGPAGFHQDIEIPCRPTLGNVR